MLLACLVLAVQFVLFYLFVPETYFNSQMKELSFQSWFHFFEPNEIVARTLVALFVIHVLGLPKFRGSKILVVAGGRYSSFDFTALIMAFMLLVFPSGMYRDTPFKMGLGGVDPYLTFGYPFAFACVIWLILLAGNAVYFVAEILFLISRDWYRQRRTSKRPPITNRPSSKLQKTVKSRFLRVETAGSRSYPSVCIKLCSATMGSKNE